jgi:hypothetical protein
MKPVTCLAASSALSLCLATACGAAPDDLGSQSDDLKLVQAGGDIADPVDTSTTAPIRRSPIGVIISSPPVATVVFTTPNADLKLDGVMRYYGGGTPTLGLQINVTNVGSSPATGTSGRVSVAGVVLSGALYQYYGGTSQQANTVNPGEHGYIKVEVPATLLAACSVYAVQIDLDRTMQAGDASVFANDSATVSTVCPLHWTTVIDQVTLGHVAAPAVQGKTLGNIVSSFVSGRPDGALCSHCHNANASYPYHPNFPPDGSGYIDPFLPVSGTQTWICGGPPVWSERFVNLPVTTYPHTPDLKEVVSKWVADGAIR